MNIRIIYSYHIPFFRVRQKTKHFLQGSAYIHRNGVFTHTDALITFNVRKNTVDIICEENDVNTIDQIRKYMQFVFGEKPIGLRISDPKQYKAFSVLNFVRI